jgi:hypothetical protein
MINRFTTSVAAIALIAGTSFAYAQGTGTSHETPSAGSTSQQSAPSSDRGGASSATPMNRDEKAQGGKNQRAQGDMKAGEKQQKSAQESPAKGEQSKTMSSDNEKAKGGSKEMKAEGRENHNGMKAEGREDHNKMKAEGREDRNGKKAEGREDRSNMKAEGREGSESKTVGQAGAGAKLSTEQRTKITSVFREEHVAPATNVNFAISVGTRVPRDVRFHRLPAKIVTIYPEWRGYEFIRVRDQIVVIDPQTYEIVAVLEA